MSERMTIIELAQKVKSSIDKFEGQSPCLNPQECTTENECINCFDRKTVKDLNRIVTRFLKKEGVKID